MLSAHKGIRDYEVRITGKAAHSSDPRMGASAIHEAIDLLGTLRRIAREQEDNAPKGSEFDPSWTTITVGEIGGGTAPNILARECRFVFDVRTVPGNNPDAMLQPFFDHVARVNEKLAKLGPECGVIVDKRADAPPLQLHRDSAASTTSSSISDVHLERDIVTLRQRLAWRRRAWRKPTAAASFRGSAKGSRCCGGRPIRAWCCA